MQENPSTFRLTSIHNERRCISRLNRNNNKKNQTNKPNSKKKNNHKKRIRARALVIRKINETNKQKKRTEIRKFGWPAANRITFFWELYTIKKYWHWYNYSSLFIHSPAFESHIDVADRVLCDRVCVFLFLTEKKYWCCLLVMYDVCDAISHFDLWCEFGCAFVYVSSGFCFAQWFVDGDFSHHYDIWISLCIANN